MSVREERVSSWAINEGSRPARKAARQLMVRGMPLKEMHLRPTSRMSSAASRGVKEESGGEEAVSSREGRDAGELRVNVAAAWGES